MYAFTGGTFLDNLGRIYYPAIGDSAIIKSVFPLRGITNFTGTAFDFNYNLVDGNNPVPAGTTFEFRMTNWGTANTGAWTAFVNNASLETARAALTGYDSEVGIDLQFRVTGTTAVAGRYWMSAKFPVTIDAAYDPPVGYTEVGVSGAQAGTLIAGYLNATPSAPALQASSTLAGGGGSVPMPYDYNAVPVPYRLVARKAGWTFSSLSGTYKKTALSIPITQLEVLDATGAALYLAGVTGVAVDHAAQTITISANRSAAQIWSAVQDDLCLLANLTRANPFDTANGSSYLSSYTLVASAGITAGIITANVTTTSTLASSVVITGNVTATPVSLTGVRINGNLTFTGPATINLSGCTITGTVSNSGSGTVTINLSDSSIGTVGARVTTRPVTALTLTGLTAGSQIYVANGGGTQVAFVASSSTSYSLVTTGETGTWTWKVTRYGFSAQTGTHSPAVASTSVAVTLLPDLFITQANRATVAAYAVLDTLDKLYDYAAYYETTAEGIAYARIITKAGTSASAGSYPVEINYTGDLWIFDGSSLSIWTGYELAPGVTLTGALFTTGVVTLPDTFNNASIIAPVTQPYPGDMTGVSITGTLTYQASDPYPFFLTLTSCSVSGVTSNAGASDVIITKVNTTLGALGARVTARQFATISAPNLLTGTTVRLVNTTNNIVLDETVTTGVGYSFSTIFLGNKTLELRYAKLGYMMGKASGALTSGGATFLDSQVVNPVYNANGVNGASLAAAEFSTDFANVQIDISDPDKVTTYQRLYAWFSYVETTAEGLEKFAGAITATDVVNYVINVNVANIKLDNRLSTPVQILGGSMTASDGSSIIAANSGSIQIDPSKAYLASSDSITSDLAAIRKLAGLIPGML
jgi:hypothetical protein